MTGLRVVTVVCTGNLCRSPMAAAFLDRHLGERGVHDIEVRSAGTGAEPGTPAMGGAQRAAAALRHDLSRHRATLLDGPGVAGSFLVLCATRAHRDDILERFEDADPSRVRLINEPLEGEAPLDVDDPFGWDDAVYHLAARVLDGAMEAWAERLAAGWEPGGAQDAHAPLSGT